MTSAWTAKSRSCAARLMEKVTKPLEALIKVQAKSGESYAKQDTESGFKTPIEKADIEAWYSAPYPVLFIVYHPKDDKLYYMEIKSDALSTEAIFHRPFTFGLTRTLMSSGQTAMSISLTLPASVLRVSLTTNEKTLL
jgi:hypothetical protein